MFIDADFGAHGSGVIVENRPQAHHAREVMRFLLPSVYRQEDGRGFSSRLRPKLPELSGIGEKGGACGWLWRRQSAGCCVWCVACCVLYVVCCVSRVVCYVLSVVCGVACCALCVTWCIWCVMCCVLCIVFGLLCIACCLLCFVCSVWYGVLHIVCYLVYVVYYVLCVMSIFYVW